MVLRRFATFVGVVLALGACSWGQAGHDASRAGYHPFDGGLNAANVAQVALQWSAAESVTGPNASAPVTDGVRVFRVIRRISGNPILLAYAVDGGTGCTGQPRVCTAIWSATLPIDGPYADIPQPMVEGGKVFVGGVVGGRTVVTGYDAAGTARCSGAPRVCLPVWRADVGASSQAPDLALTWDSGRVYVSGPSMDQSPVVVLSGTGTQNCTGAQPVTCTPLFTTTPVEPDALPAIANGRLFVDSMAFDAAGVEGCVAQVCAPLFTFGGDGGQNAVSGGRLYQAITGQVGIFDPAGVANCVGVPAYCAPRALMFGPAGSTRIVVADDRLIAPGNDGSGGHFSLSAFDAGGSLGCTGAPKQCAPLWRFELPNNEFPMGIGAVGALVFATGSDFTAEAHLYVLAIHPTACPSASDPCPALQSIPLGEKATTEPVLTNGRVIVGGRDSALRVFGLPAAT